MKISRNWLQTYFDETLPPAQILEETLTFHAFEIDGIEKQGEDDILDVKVTPNRGHDCLSHRGIAKEIAAILQLKMKDDPLANTVSMETTTHAIAVQIADSTLCPRYVGGYIRGVKVAPSPQWLVDALESVGQRSINNVVDATNYVMWQIGQPLHAFDAARLEKQHDTYQIAVRPAKPDEVLDALDGKSYTLNDSILIITDAHADKAIGIAGIKGGTPASITEETTDIILESANFHGPTIRKAGHQIKLRTDASQRFEQVISPELAAYGMRMVADLIVQLAGGTIEGFVDVYPQKQEIKAVSVSVSHLNALLGTSLTSAEVASVFERLGFNFNEDKEVFEVTVPFERLDITIAEDLIEEVVRIIGYDSIGYDTLPPVQVQPEVNPRFYGAERIREYLISQGFSEVFTSVFSEEGERLVANKVDGVRPYLRKNVLSGSTGLHAALEKNIKNKDLLGLSQIKIFEIGTVWTEGEEIVVVGLAVEQKKKTKAASDYLNDLARDLGWTTDAVDTKKGLAYEIELPLNELIQYLSIQSTYEQLPITDNVKFKPFSKYPFITRDIALWTPLGTKPEDVLSVIVSEAGELLVRTDHIDTYEKEGRVSLAFRLIFQSFEKTLTDAEVGEIMQRITTALTNKGWEVR